MNPILNINLHSVENNKNASSKRVDTISNVSFMDSFKDVAKAQKMVVTDGAGLRELGFLKNKEVLFDKGFQGEDEEERIQGFLTKIKNILVGKEKKEGGEK